VCSLREPPRDRKYWSGYYILSRGKKWDGPLGFPHDRYSIVWTTAKD